jgi:hypothetical protein
MRPGECGCVYVCFANNSVYWIVSEARYCSYKQKARDDISSRGTVYPTKQTGDHVPNTTPKR